jgi:hypothetical protein
MNVPIISTKIKVKIANISDVKDEYELLLFEMRSKFRMEGNKFQSVKKRLIN